MNLWNAMENRCIALALYITFSLCHLLPGNIYLQLLFHYSAANCCLRRVRQFKSRIQEPSTIDYLTASDGCIDRNPLSINRLLLLRAAGNCCRTIYIHCVIYIIRMARQILRTGRSVGINSDAFATGNPCMVTPASCHRRRFIHCDRIDFLSAMLQMVPSATDLLPDTTLLAESNLP